MKNSYKFQDEIELACVDEMIDIPNTNFEPLQLQNTSDNQSKTLKKASKVDKTQKQNKRKKKSQETFLKKRKGEKIDVANVTFDDCPFNECPILVQTSTLESHKIICPFNPSKKRKNFKCLFIGCKHQFETKKDLLDHYPSCFFSLPRNLQKELQLEIIEKNFEVI